MSETQQAEGQAILTHEVGLHARPAVKLTQLAARFACQVKLKAGDGGDWVDAKSIVKVMKLKARTNEMLFFEAVGEGAQQAVEELVGLVERKFDEQSL